MPVTTREYNSSTSRPRDILQSLHDALTDLNWFEPQPLGYLCTFTNTPGSTIIGQANQRYLVLPSATTAPIGTEAVFDVLRSPVGAISAVTLVTGGSGYYIRGVVGATSSGTTITVPDTAGINPGMVVAKLTGGTGTLQTNTTVVSITNSTQLVVDQAPSVVLNNATLSFADTITLSASSIGGSIYTVSATGTAGQTTIVVANATNVFVGQRVLGTGIGSLAVVTSIVGTTVTLSKANAGTVNGEIQFSDEILVTVTGNANTEGLTGTASGLTITNVASNANIYVGGTVEITDGTPTWDSSNGTVMIASITGAGPYTVTLRNEEGTFKGFTSTGPITFRVASGSEINWFEVDRLTAPQTYGWAVAKIKNANNKKLGNTFWLFYVGYGNALYNNVVLSVRPLAGFNPLTNVAQGVASLDWLAATAATNVTTAHYIQTVASSPFVPHKLRVRQSGLDANFATFGFFEGNNNKNPFFISKYNTNFQPWDLDDVFLGGITEIFQAPVFNTGDTGILFRTRMNAPKRMAETGYGNYNLVAAGGYTNTYFRTTTGSRILPTPGAFYDDIALYSRQTGDIQTSVTTTYPVYKTIPINPHFMPVPQYLPDDFVLLELPWMNAAIGDTITVSEEEVYTIIQIGTNQTTLTSIGLAARTT
jgi:hypothetical protein